MTEQFLCPKCEIILRFNGLTFNKVYEQYECQRCGHKFLHWYDNLKKYSNRYIHGWYDETYSPWTSLIYEGEFPKLSEKEVVQFT